MPLDEETPIVDSVLYRRVRQVLEPVLHEIIERRRNWPPAIEVLFDKPNPEDVANGVLRYRLRLNPDVATQTEREAWQRMMEDTPCAHPNSTTTGWSEGSIEHFHCPDCDNVNPWLSSTRGRKHTPGLE